MSADTDLDSWCAWHNDHGALTGLSLAMYLDEDGNVVRSFAARAAGAKHPHM